LQVSGNTTQQPRDTAGNTYSKHGRNNNKYDTSYGLGDGCQQIYIPEYNTLHSLFCENAIPSTFRDLSGEFQEKTVIRRNCPHREETNSTGSTHTTATNAHI
jgi:hypothetical protein